MYIDRDIFNRIDMSYAHQGVHLSRQTKNLSEICDFRIRTEIQKFRKSFTISGYLKWEGSQFQEQFQATY
jgi:hypothetical protein